VTVTVDPAAGLVVDGDDAWPVRLDCRTGGAVLSVRDRDIEITPMRWRHKQRLARWAHLGPEFVAEQVATLAVAPGTELSDTERALVVALSTFVDRGALPFEPALLAAVTIDACRATGLVPAALDDRDAFEVEAIWRVAHAARSFDDAVLAEPGAPDDRDPWADATSIVFDTGVVVPDRSSTSVDDVAGIERDGGPAEARAGTPDATDEVLTSRDAAGSARAYEPVSITAAQEPPRRPDLRFRVTPSWPRPAPSTVVDGPDRARWSTSLAADGESDRSIFEADIRAPSPGPRDTIDLPVARPALVAPIIPGYETHDTSPVVLAPPPVPVSRVAPVALPPNVPVPVPPTPLPVPSDGIDDEMVDEIVAAVIDRVVDQVMAATLGLGIEV
jgi:hypothetical protein